MTTYVYRPLETRTSIRLLELLPADDEDAPLHCRIHHVDLDDDSSPPYAAVSYVWGSEENLDSIIVHSVSSDDSNGTSTGETLPRISITRNLSLALRSIRKPSPNDPYPWVFQEGIMNLRERPRFLWADAVCIDQADSNVSAAEKHVQIPLMGKVFSLAKCVLIYLGPESVLPPGVVQSAVHCVWTLFTQVVPQWRELEDWVAEHKTFDELFAEKRASEALGGSSRIGYIKNGEEMCRHFGIPSDEEPMYAALSQVLSLPWFKRVWTFQEGFLARKRYFFIGDLVIPGQVVGLIMAICPVLAEKGGLGFKRQMGWLQTRHAIRVHGTTSGWTHWDMVSLLKLIRGSDCKVPVDMVFGILGILASYTDQQRDGREPSIQIQVDYSKSVSEVFADVARKEILATGRLGILGLSDTVSWWGMNSEGAQEKTGSRHVPSWAPDWRIKCTHRAFSCLNTFSYTANIRARIYIPGCTATTRVALEPSTSHIELRIRGILFDTVTDVAPTESPDIFPASLASQLPTLNLEHTKGLYLPTGERIRLAILRTLCADMRIFTEEFVPSARLSERWTAHSVQLVEAIEKLETHGRLIKKIGDMLHCSRLFATKDGKLGVAPLSVRAGDVVCLALGGDVPLLLRKYNPPGCDDGEEHHNYRFVGESYLHGFMDGEGLVEARKQADPSYDGEDRDWLLNLSECDVGQLPFKTTAICIY
ncbi:Heterokaryon incompatibility protein (HET) domain containing protein [Naviculisporaceae sp. PSN 640]